MFKKPKRNFRGRKADSTEDSNIEENIADIENVSYGTKSNGNEGGENTSGNFDETKTTHADGEDGKREKVKKKKKKDKDGMGKKSSSVLSFVADEGDSEEVFTIKKSSHSKKVARQLKKELLKEKEEQEARKKEQYKIKVETVKEKTVIETIDNSQDTVQNGNNSPGPGSDIDFSDNEEPTFGETLRSGQIPDAAMIHAIRKKRQMAREMGDFIPVDDTVKYQNEKSRLVREDENDDSEEESRVNFTVPAVSSESDLRRIQQTILEAHEESNSDGSDHEWEVQQIRKGVSIPAQQTKEADQSDGPMFYGGYEQFVYSDKHSNSTPTFSLGNDSPYLQSSEPIKRTIPVSDLPKINMELVVKRLRERLEEMSTVHRTHVHERDDLAARLETCEEDIVTYGENTEGLGNQYRFFQEMRGYVTDLVECLNEKMPQIQYIERSLFKLWQKGAEKIVQRRQQDIRDESQDCLMSMSKPTAVDANQNQEKQRRVAEREARRTRRRRKREMQGIQDHVEGQSTDDEQNRSELAHYNTEKERLTMEAAHLLEDVDEEFAQMKRVQKRFERWRDEQGESYHEAYIALCLPKLFTPFVKLKLLSWNPLEPNCEDFLNKDWYEDLMFYGYQEGREITKSDDDLKVMPNIIEKVLLPKLTGLVENVWDPMSTQRTQRLVQTMKKHLSLYPTLTSESKNTKLLVKAVVQRIRKTLDDDVFMPLYPKEILQTKGPMANFFSRQLNTCFKLLGNILLWHGVIGEKPLQEMALDALLNRYIMLGLQNSTFNQDIISSCQQICTMFPKEWFSSLEGESTIPQLEGLCRFLSHSVAAVEANSTGVAQRDAREMVKQITKMLVNINAMDHAMAMASKFSLKI